MAERSVRVRLTAVIDDYRKAMGEASKATGQVGDAAEDAEKKSSRIGDAARAAGKVAVTGLGIAAGATAALGVAAFKAGVNYNNLEQQSRMALTTMLGSTEAANAQMERLVAFGRTSPFPRQVWLEAQQQLIGFGLEAERVVPTLSAIQDAAAATGRTSAADIGEIVNVFAKIQSTGQITARELNQLGIRGIDAAALLGQAYGKTADQIRDDITSGALDGRQALVDLTDEMSIRFAGAAEGLRVTWFGAVDRIKGAFRDIGSIIAAPFVDPAGGGTAVDWANALADAMRALEGVMGPVVADLADRAGPAFDSITNTLERASAALSEVDVANVIDQLTKFAPAITALGTAGLAAGVSGLPGVLGRLGSVLIPGGPLVAGIAAFVLSSPEMRDLLGDLFEAVEPLVPVLIDLAEAVIPALSDVVGILAEALVPVVALIAETVEGTLILVDHLGELGLAAKQAGDDTNWWERSGADLTQQLFEMLGITEDSTEATQLFRSAAQDAGEASDDAADGVETLEDGLSDAEQAALDAEEALSTYLETVKRATDPVYALHGALGDVEAAQDAYNEAVEEYGPASKEAEDAAFNLMGKIGDLEAAALDGELSFEEFESKLADWVDQGRITQDQADTIRERVKELTGVAEDYQGEYNAKITETGATTTIEKLKEIGAIIDGLPSRKDVTIAALTGTHTPTFGVTRQAQGGPINGPGTSTSDSIPALLSDGEWVMKAAARAKYGDKMMAAINSGTWPMGGGQLPHVHVEHESDLDGADFINAAGRAAASLGVAAGLSSGRVLPRGSYRIGRGSAAHGYGALDLPAITGTPVASVAAGIVSRALSLATSYGKHVFVNHPGGRQSRYAHLSRMNVSAGQQVGAGQRLGAVGSTGNSTGPHLHYEDLLNGVRRRPESLGIFHEGGLTKPGSFGQFDKYQPERVLTTRQNQSFERLVAAIEGGGSSGPLVIENHIEVGGEVVRVVRTEISEHDRGIARRVGAGTGRAR